MKIGSNKARPPKAATRPPSPNPDFYILHSPFFIPLPVPDLLQQRHPSLTVGALTFIMPP